MTDNPWAKAATATLSILVLIAGWGLAHLVTVTDPKINAVDMRVTVIDTKLDIWMTPTPGPARPARGVFDDRMIYLAGASLRGEQGAEFMVKAARLAADQIMQKNCDGALQTLLVGLDSVGLKCSPSGDHLDCFDLK